MVLTLEEFKELVEEAIKAGKDPSIIEWDKDYLHNIVKIRKQ